MAKVSNLRIPTNGKAENPRRVYFSIDVKDLFQNKVKKVYCNDELIWQNSNPFIFVKNINDIDVTKLDADTLIFEGFGEEEFEGTYDEMGSPTDIPTAKGQMVVETTPEGDD
jgi:hypothetical protein